MRMKYPKYMMNPPFSLYIRRDGQIGNCFSARTVFIRQNVCRRQILTYKAGRHTEELKKYIIVVDPYIGSVLGLRPPGL